MLLTPQAGQQKLPYVSHIVKALGGTKENAQAVKARILQAFEDLVTSIADARVKVGGHPSADGAMAHDPRVTSSRKEHQSVIDAISGDPFETVSPVRTKASSSRSDGEGAPNAPPSLTPREMARKEIAAYLGMADPPTIMQYALSQVLLYWEKEGSLRFEFLTDAARLVHAIRAAAAGIERDFCLAGFLVSPHRSSLDPAFVEMTLVLNSLDRDEMPRPEYVPALTPVEAAASIPTRFIDDEALATALQLDASDTFIARTSRAKRSQQAEIDAQVQNDVLAKTYEDVEFDEESEEEDGADDMWMDDEDEGEQEEAKEEATGGSKGMLGAGDEEDDEGFDKEFIKLRNANRERRRRLRRREAQNSA